MNLKRAQPWGCSSVSFRTYRKKKLKFLCFSNEEKLKIASFAASGLSGFFGAAGALSFNWIVQWWLGRDMKQVNGLALFTISISAVVSIVIRGLWRVQPIHADWQRAKLLGLSIGFGMLGVILGKFFEQRLKERRLRISFIGMLLFVGVKMLGLVPLGFFTLFSDKQATAVIWSLIAGISSPPLGMGAGVFLVPAFLGMNFSRDESILGSLIVSAVLMLFGSWLFRRSRQLELHDMRHVWLPALIGTPIGVWLSYQISPEHFHVIFCMLLIIGAVKTFCDISISPKLRRSI